MKRVLISGGNRGIGLACAKRFIAGGYQAVIFARSPEAEDFAARLGAEEKDYRYIRGDISSAEDRRALLEEAGPVDVLINNAGVAPKVRKDILDMDEADYDYVMDINAKGTFFLSRDTAKNMIEHGTKGRIINMSSVSAYASSPERAQYCLSKAAISMMTKLYADRLASENILVYEIRPGIIRTDMTEGVSAKYDRLIHEEGILPIARWGEGEDVAKACFALCGEGFQYSTGQVINVDGGFHIRRL